MADRWGPYGPGPSIRHVKFLPDSGRLKSLYVLRAFFGLSRVVCRFEVPKEYIKLIGVERGCGFDCGVKA